MDVYITRHPVFDRSGALFGYVMPYRENDAGTGKALLEADPESIVGSAKAFVFFDFDMILHGVPRKMSPETLVALVSANMPSHIEIINQLGIMKSGGYLIALEDIEDIEDLDELDDNELLKLCDIAVIDINAERFAEIAKKCTALGKQILAKNAETAEQAERAKSLGASYVQGFFFARFGEGSKREVQPLPANLVEVMRLMANPEPEIRDIVEVMSRDTAMCQKILKLINSVYFGVSNSVSSINQAILILGLDYLREWVYLMGMQKLTQNDNSETIKLALLLAKFCRRLAELIPDVENKGDTFYLMGLLSMLVFSGEKSLETSLDEFPLSADIKRGLLRRGGVYSDVLEIALAFAAGNWERFEALGAAYNLDRPGTGDKLTAALWEIGELELS